LESAQSSEQEYLPQSKLLLLVIWYVQEQAHP
jgi:hypothetical protein